MGPAHRARDRAAVVGGGEARYQNGRRHLGDQPARRGGRRSRPGTLAVLDIARWQPAPIALVHAQDMPLAPPAERFVALLQRANRARERRRRRPTGTSRTTCHTAPRDERELAEEIVKLLRDGSRLVTFTGPGGSSSATCGRDRRGGSWTTFEDGVYLVELCAASRPRRRTGTAIADVLVSVHGIELIERLRGPSMLLVLDNFERLPRGRAPLSRPRWRPPRARVARHQPPAAPRRRGEREYRVEPLGPGPPRGRLFLQRARDVNPRFGATAGRCGDLRAARPAAASARARGRPRPRNDGHPARRLLEAAAGPCSPAGATPRPGSGRSRPRSPGATTCSPSRSSELFVRLAVFAGGGA